MNLNQSGEPTRLEFLPPELQCQILKSVSNMKALRALLRASPRCFQVYRTCREMILSHVAWNHITPAVVPIALNALKMRENRTFQRDRTEPFLSQKTLQEPHEIPLSTWEKLLCFHEIVDSFILGFTNSRLVALENSIHPQSQTSLPSKSPGRKEQKKKITSLSTHLSLSQLEYSRLARAFYNLELYSNLFYDLAISAPWTAFLDASLKRAITFLQSLRDWEFEELLCVQSYMTERLVDFLNKFEDDFMEAYLRDRPYINWEPQNNLLLPRLGWNIHLFDVDWRLKSWIEDCLTRGLEILSAILSAQTISARYKALQDNYSTAQTVCRAMYNHPQWAVTEKIESSPIGCYNNIKQPNEAWFWAINFREDCSILTKPDIFHGWDLDGCDINHFRRWGYVIWDDTRLDRLGILNNSPSNILANIGTDWMVERTPGTLKERTMKQEEIWSQRRRSMRIASTLSERRPVFAWQNLWFDESSEHRKKGVKERFGLD